MPRNFPALQRMSTHSQSGFAVRLSRGVIFLVLLLAVPLGWVVLATGASSQAQFAHPSFQAVWDAIDGPIASGSATGRSWTWGPVPGAALTEPFAGLPGGSHFVQYFDKGRMEINNPNGDPKDPFFVTNGLLAVELISGQLQTGTSTYQNRGAAVIDLASDADDPTAPTYQSFNGVSNIPGAPNERRKQSQIGAILRTAIDRQGNTQSWPQDHPDYGVHVAYFEPQTSHNIPDVFWTFLNSEGDLSQGGKLVRGPLFSPWFKVTGYPISEAYWSYVKVQGTYTDVLVQAFERRVLTFVPHLPSPFKVQMGNIGQHYYDWRYSQPKSGPPQPGPASPTSQALPPKAKISIVSINYRSSIIDLNGNFITLRNDDAQPQNFSGWFLDSPKWNYVDRYYFPSGTGSFILAPGASVNIHAGPGNDTASDLYMFRTSVMWDGQPYDLAVLYDNHGREVDRFFPAAEQGPPPTAQSGGTPTGGPQTPFPSGTRVGTPVTTPVSTPQATKPLPSPVSTSQATLTGITPSPSTAPTQSPGRGTPTATASPTRVPQSR
ncbi:MAG: lamin tail domain-containing protein [Chloroflexota bacterium]|nr:lamin tail domain-containing protein [Chloroflexota bacterium]